MPKEAQTYPEMVESERERKSTSKLYRVESSAFVDGQISSLVERAAKDLTKIADTEPVSLRDTERIKERTLAYMEACQAAGSIPSISGLSRSMGLSRQAVYDCIYRKSPPATAAWLEITRDTFSDILGEAALRNNTNSVVSIFLEKAIYGLRETVEVVARQETPMGAEPDQQALEQRIIGSIVMED